MLRHSESGYLARSTDGMRAIFGGEERHKVSQSVRSIFGVGERHKVRKVEHA